ncbi:MAG: hypothetical protein C5B55_12080 [Blastocatellia bacterium]|nr:MAG: hypothetical protein C5B55_12080 [Blastocatellia bacterium]
MTIGYKLRRDDLSALLSILIFFITFFANSIFGNGYRMAGDSLFYTYPLRAMAWKMIRSGHLPLWTPGILSGYPLLSMAQLGLGYPITWFYLVLPPYLAEKIYVLAPFLLAPVFTYAYLRQVNRSALASLFSALTFGYGGMMASPLSNNGLIPNTFMWLPLFLLVIERSRRSPLIPCVIAATFVYSLSVLSGFAQAFIIVGLVAAGYSLWLALAVAPDLTTEKVSRWRPVIITAGAGVFSFGVAAFQILETARVVRRSVRHTLTYQLFTQGSFEPAELWRSFTTPLFHVIDTHASVVPLAAALACIAVATHVVRRTQQRDPRVFFWFLVAVVAIVLMMGQFTPISWALYKLPIINLFRVPSRHTTEWTFAAAVLAAYGWDALGPLALHLRNSKPRSNLITIWSATLLIVVALLIGHTWWTRAQTFQPQMRDGADPQTIYNLWKLGMSIVLALTMWRASLIINQRWRESLLILAILITCFVEPSLLLKRWWENFGRPVSAAQQPTEMTRYLQQFHANENRIYTRVDLMSEQEGAPPRFDAPNLSAMWGLQDVAGYEPLILERYSQALGGAYLDGVHTVDRGTPDASLFTSQSHVLDLLNTKHTVSYRGLATSLGGSSGPPTPHSEYWQPVFELNQAVVMRNSRALPRVWLVGEAKSVRGEVALSLIRGESKGVDFDPARTVLLETNQSEIPSLPAGALPTDCVARVAAYQPTLVIIETKCSSAAVLVVSEMFFPGWVASMDGNSANIQVADYLLRGVFVTPGEHKIEMRYTAPAFRNGALISISALILLSALLIIHRRRRLH